MHPFMGGSKTKTMWAFPTLSGVFIADIYQWKDFIEAALAIAQSDVGLKDIFSQLYAQILGNIQDDMAQPQASHQEKRNLVYLNLYLIVGLLSCL